MKRFWIVLLALMLCASCAGAEIERRAATTVETNLLDASHDGASVLMTYYPGVRVEVIGQPNAEYVQVNVGNKGGSLMGYMRKDDLVFGEANIRQIIGLQVSYGWLDWTMYSYCDTSSKVISTHNDTFIYAMGESGRWIHARQQSGSDVTTGFVKKDGAYTVKEDERITYESFVDTEPLPGEVTLEAAIERAKQCLLEDGEMANGQDGVPITREMLDSCRVETAVRYYHETQSLIYDVTFIYTDRTWEDGFPMLCAFVELWVEGDEIVKHGYGNG